MVLLIGWRKYRNQQKVHDLENALVTAQKDLTITSILFLVAAIIIGSILGAILDWLIGFPKEVVLFGMIGIAIWGIKAQRSEYNLKKEEINKELDIYRRLL